MLGLWPLFRIITSRPRQHICRPPYHMVALWTYPLSRPPLVATHHRQLQQLHRRHCRHPSRHPSSISSQLLIVSTRRSVVTRNSMQPIQTKHGK